MEQCILKEARLRRDYLHQQQVNTIYFGGGTPSLLHEDAIGAMLNTIRDIYPIGPDPEITIEANPDDINTEKVKAWRKSGINRVSLGVQSFFPEHLHWMRRIHSAQEAEDAIHILKNEGLVNINLDLIYGLPDLSDEQWIANLNKAVSFGVQHLSCYALTVEEKTILGIRIKRKQMVSPSQEKQAKQMKMLMDYMRQAGFRHYEISNFSIPGFESRHNSSYWNGTHYLGLGAGAHSYDGNSRQWNFSNNTRYINEIEKERCWYEKEELSLSNKFDEYVMIALRTSEGISESKISSLWGVEKYEKLMRESDKWLQKGYLSRNHDHISLTQEGILFADGIASDLFQPDH